MKREYVKNLLIGIFTMIILVVLMLGIFFIKARSQSLYKASPTSLVEIKGTSTLHDWVMKSNEVKLTVVFSENDQHQINGITNLSLIIPVSSLKSTEGSLMDNKAYKALKADAYPQIEFRANTGNVKYTGNAYQISAKGNLTIAGVTHLVTVNTVCKIVDAHRLSCSGDKPIDMTDYRVSPPTFMGLMKTGKEVTIHFVVDLFSTDGLSFNN
ncbi:MAG: YceI family protein [Thermoflavifilum sp.]|nr:YceI family protein [Thermoflavifilum sp.]